MSPLRSRCSKSGTILPLRTAEAQLFLSFGGRSIQCSNLRGPRRADNLTQSEVVILMKSALLAFGIPKIPLTLRGVSLTPRVLFNRSYGLSLKQNVDTAVLMLRGATFIAYVAGRDRK